MPWGLKRYCGTVTVLPLIGYVVMPEHVHLLISEPWVGNPSKVIQAVKLSLSRQLATKGEFDGQF